MDKTDLKILDILKENGRATASEISRQVALSVPAAAERNRKMERAGIIEGYSVKVNDSAMGYSLLAFIFVTIDSTENIEGFRKKIVQKKNVMECHHIVGQSDYLLKVRVADTEELEHFISNELKGIKGVSSSNTIISLSTLKEESNV